MTDVGDKTREEKPKLIGEITRENSRKKAERCCICKTLFVDERNVKEGEYNPNIYAISDGFGSRDCYRQYLKNSLDALDPKKEDYEQMLKTLNRLLKNVDSAKYKRESCDKL